MLIGSNIFNSNSLSSSNNNSSNSNNVFSFRVDQILSCDTYYNSKRNSKSDSSLISSYFSSSSNHSNLVFTLSFLMLFLRVQCHMVLGNSNKLSHPNRIKHGMILISWESFEMTDK